MIDVKDLYKSYGNFPVLAGLNLHVEKGAVYGLIGSNGTGKTTLLKLLAGIYQEDSGRITFEGKEIYENNEVKERMCFLSDSHYFFGLNRLVDVAKVYNTIYKNFDMGVYDKLVNAFHLDDQKTIRGYSKGMKKQGMFILMIAAQPDLLLLDELIDGIDPQKRRLIWSVLMKEVSQREMTVMIASHNIKELEGICSHIGIIRDGKCVLEDDIENIREEYEMNMEEFIIGMMGGETDEAKEFLYE